MTTQKLNSLFDKLYTDWNNKPLLVLPSSINAKPPHGQCFDLAAKWAQMLGVPNYPGNPSAFPYQNASQIYTDFGPFQAQYFDRIENTITAIPQRGDIIVWDAKLNNGMGHVALGDRENYQDYFVSFDENWDPSNWYPKHIEHLYEIGPVLGWLRPKVTSSPQPPMDPTIQHKASIADRIVKAREGQQEDPGHWTDAQEKAFIERMLREKNRAVEFDRDVIAAFGTGVDSNTKTSAQVVAALKKPIDKPKLKADLDAIVDKL